jgi:ribonuclease G
MSKELVISAASHERRVAILEEGQLVEIYIEREKEFALVGSIYKGRVTRVLPGMQSAFVDIGLDGDAFLYVSDVFENLEDYDGGHAHPEPGRPAIIPPAAALAEVLPGETLGRAQSEDEAPHDVMEHAVEEHLHASDARHHEEALSGVAPEEIAAVGEEHAEAAPQEHELAQATAAEERQPESNASAPQNFAPSYNPTQKYTPRSDRGGERNDRSGQDFGRGGDRGGRGRWGRRGGRRRGGRPQGSGDRNLPPSKYASPQGGPRDQQHQHRGYDNRRPERQDRPAQGPPSAPGASTEEPFVLPGESLAKYRGKPPAASSAPPVVEHPSPEPQREAEDTTGTARGSIAPPLGTATGGNLPRRSSGVVPSWLLADTGETSTEAETPAASASAAETASAPEPYAADREPSESSASETSRLDASLSEEEAVVLSTSLIEAKQEEIQAKAPADALVGGAEFEEEAEAAEEAEELLSAEEELSEEQSEEEDDEAEHHAATQLADAEADAAHESAHAEAMGEHPEGTPAAHEHADAEIPEALAAAPGAPAPAAGDDALLLPGETRAPRIGGGPASPAPREDFPRDSARIGGDPRARFQRPYRSGGGRDRGRDSRGGGGRPDRRGGRPPQRFERRGPGGPHRGQQGGHAAPRRPHLISEMLKSGQEVVVQIAKEPLGKKGARITSHVALPGRFLVYMPTIDHIGVSRKIASADNRSRLRRLVGEARGSYPGGFIVRTAAGGASDEEIRADIEFLGHTWHEIKERNEQRKSPALLHRDLNLVERILRDYVSDDFTAIWIDNEEEYGKVVEFVSRFQPKLVSRVKLYSKQTPIFEEFGIQHELDKALRAKVWLKSGGYIVINHTEALVAIDVNTGKFVGKGSTRLEDTIVKTNLEAVKEIVRQIRLRDLGGIIVVDFIDMEERRNREKVLVALQQALEQDKAPSKALSFNEFGLVCITRKRTKQALERVLCQPCPYCTGSGMVKSTPTLCYEIQAEARKMAAADHEQPNLTLRVHPEIAKALKTRESMLIDELEQTTHKHVIIQSDATLHWEQYDIC